ncbi:MAG: 1-(5-phosphoribosyl)-5-[(5-phosphoribosylamino)methylideneamino]imidazole-4-carboxamide isomerase [Anaerolineales bacterium]
MNMMNGITEFVIYPAIDLRGGRVVRLAQGDPNRETVYSDDPLETARRWESEGAVWLHVVNLDGAFGEATAANGLALAEILRVGLKVQLGGGMRNIDGISRALDSGVSRIVIGTAAIENPKLVDVAMRKFGPEKIAAGIDARGGKANIRGWTASSSVSAVDLGKRLAEQGVRWCVFTDIERDGVSAGVNIPATVDLAEQTGLQVIASGGVSSAEDVAAAARAGLPGIIIGRALYEGSLTLQAALETLR